MTFNRNRYPSWLLALSITQAGALLVFMSFAGALPLLQAEWQLSNIQAGFIQAAGQIGYLIAVLIISSLTDFMDSKILIVGGAFWAGIWNLGFAWFAHDVTSAVVIRIMIGMGIAGIYMPGVKLISQKTSSSQRGSALGLFVASFTLGSAISIALGGNLASMLGWRMAFGITSIGPLLGGLVSIFALPKTEKQISAQKQFRPLSELRINKEILVIIIIYACHTWEVLGLRSWIATYLTEVKVFSGIGLIEATRIGATMAGAATLVAAAATATMAAFSDRLGRTKTIMAMMGLGFIFTFSLGFSFTFSWPVIITISFISAFLSNADSAVISAILTEAVPSDYLGRTLALYSFVGFAAGSISPLAFGAALDIGSQLVNQNSTTPWIFAFGTLAFASVIGLAGSLWLHRRIKNNNADL